jgi:hypothetical protein
MGTYRRQEGRESTFGRQTARHVVGFSSWLSFSPSRSAASFSICSAFFTTSNDKMFSFELAAHLPSEAVWRCLR